MYWIEDIRREIASVRSSQKDLKKFGCLIGGVIILISGFALWKQWWNSNIIITLGICGFLLIAFGISKPLSLKRIHRYWMIFAIFLGSIISRIILSFLFYIILTPLAQIAKVFKKRFFSVYRDENQTSFWIDRQNGKSINYERMS